MIHGHPEGNTIGRCCSFAVTGSQSFLYRFLAQHRGFVQSVLHCATRNQNVRQHLMSDVDSFSLVLYIAVLNRLSQLFIRRNRVYRCKR